ncbi:MAG: TolC family protein [Ferruginibacter sp.]
MKLFVLALLVCCSNIVFAQSLSKMPDSVRKTVDEYNGLNQPPPAAARTVSKMTDDNVIKERLVKLAIKNNPEMRVADANIEVAEIARKKANSTVLSSVNLGGNANEFVINNSPQANFFPKYNIGVSIPLDLFAKAKAEKKTADQQIEINNAQKELKERSIRTKVLTLYEIYKEKKEQVELQKIAMEDDIAAYEKAQQDYAANAITLAELNKMYKASINEKSVLTLKQREMNVAIIDLEDAIGTTLDKAVY